MTTTDSPRFDQCLRRLHVLKATVKQITADHRDGFYLCKCGRMETRNGERCLLCNETRRTNETKG